MNQLVDSNGRLPAASVAGRSNAALGESTWRLGGSRHARLRSGRYRGPVPIVTHLHGGHSPDESDGYPEAWYLPAANNIPAGFAKTGTLVRLLPREVRSRVGWQLGSRAPQSSCTRTISARRRSGITITRSG